MDIKKQKEGLYLDVFIVILNNCKQERRHKKWRMNTFEES